MKIGVMLRHLGSPGGIGVYTVNVLNALLRVDRENQYVLLYNSPEHLGRFSEFPNVVEKVLSAPNYIWWDQITVPRYARSEGLDLIYNPKLSVPMFSRCKTALVMHGAEQFAVPWAFKWYDRVYFSLANRLYCKKANAIFAMTSIGAKDIARYMGADPGKVFVVPEAYSPHCQVIERSKAQGVKDKYSLPDNFIFFIGGVNPIKNLGNILRAYEKIQRSFPHQLVVAGFKRWQYSQDLQLVNKLGIEDKVRFVDFIDDEEVPAFYNLADLLVFPSLYEGFGMPVLEAMACGCPVVTTNTGCSPEVAGGAAVLVNPYDPDEIAQGMQRVLTDEALRESLVRKGLERAKDFSWDRCAKETLDVLQRIENPEAHPLGV